jgi:hypothetical protein
MSDPVTNPTTTDTDRQWLWRLHGLLSVTATSPTHHAFRTDLGEYLRATCPHDWDHVPAEEYAPDPTTAPDLVQCRHCCATRETPPTQAVPGARAECSRCARAVPEVPALTLALVLDPDDPAEDHTPRWWCQDCLQEAVWDL